MLDKQITINYTEFNIEKDSDGESKYSLKVTAIRERWKPDTGRRIAENHS
jgi:hypothetical protein